MDLSGAPEGTPQGGEAPDLAGFQSAAELAKAYTELRTKMSQGGAPTKGEAPAPAAPKAPAGGIDIDFESLGAEVAQFGALSAQSRATAVKAGIPESVLDNYVAGLAASRTSVMSEAHTEAGGKDQYDSLINWAKGALDQGTKNFLQAQFSQGGEQAKRSIRTMKQMFEEANGKMPGVALGGKPTGQATGAFASIDERKAAFADPRYRTDKVYRAQVEARTALGIRR